MTTLEANRVRNTRRIMDPPKPTLREWLGSYWRAVEEWRCRHITHRELYRHLDALRDLVQGPPRSP